MTNKKVKPFDSSDPYGFGQQEPERIEPTPVRQPETMPCPVKGHTGKVQIIHTPGRSYAICYCPSPNKYFGHIVWERR
jgi:hypothetical protein